MSFDWMHVKPTKQDAQRWRDQYLHSIEERARLLYNLQYSAARATQRIQADLAWEFDESIGSTSLPSFYKDVPSLVKNAYSHAQRGKGTPKGKRRK